MPAARDFRLLLAGQTTAQLGGQVSGVAIPLLAVGVLGASAFEVGLIAAASTVAFALLGLPAGAWLDRMRRRPVLIASDLARAVLLATVPLAALLGVLTIGQLVVVSLLTGVARVFFDIGYQSYIPSVIGRERVLAGNSAMEFVRSSGQVAGPGLGGVLVSAIGAAPVVLTQAVTFVISAATLWRITAREVPVDPQAHAGPLWMRIGEGVRYVARHRILRSIAVASAASNLSFAIASAVTIVFLARDLGQPAWVIGLVIAGGALAAMAGAAVTPWAARRAGSVRIVWLSLALTGPPGLLVALSFPGWGLVLAVLGMAFGELGQIVYAISNVSLRQRICPDRILARVNATMRFAIMALFPVGALVGGVLGEVLGARLTLLLSGLVVLIAPAVLYPALRMHRNVEELENA